MLEWSSDICGTINYDYFITNNHNMITPQLPLADLALPQAESRRTVGGNFLKGLLDGRVDSPTLISLINFKVPGGTIRPTATFHVPLCSANYLSLSDVYDA